MFTGYGKVVVHNNWYITLNPVDDLGTYYRKMYNWENRARIITQKPKWDSHITILRAEEPLQKKYKWQEQYGKEFEFYYDNKIITGDRHIVIDVFCPQAEELRVYFGLKREPLFPFHLTIGYIEWIINEKWFEETKEKG
jgi:hypothetical protein